MGICLMRHVFLAAITGSDLVGGGYFTPAYFNIALADLITAFQKIAFMGMFLKKNPA